MLNYYAVTQCFTLLIKQQIWKKVLLLNFKVNESRYKPCGVIPNFFTGQNLLKNILQKDNY